MPAQRKWTGSDIQFLKDNYPSKGKAFCCKALGKTDGAVRHMASELKLKASRESEFFRDWQSRAAKSKVGKKRPSQSLVMKRLHLEGKLQKNEQQRKAISERNKKMWKEREHPKGMKGKKHSKETLAKLSEISSERAKNTTDEQWLARTVKSRATREQRGTQLPCRTNVTWKAAWHEIGGTRKFYRSRWEANYARYLEFLKQQGKIKDWKHEPKTFWFEGIKRGCVSYLPDFLVIENDGSEAYHEVKGWMDDRSKTKIRRMAKYFPSVNLIVIDSKEYKALQKTAAAIVPGWDS
jgi:hypothetical protein